MSNILPAKPAERRHSALRYVLTSVGASLLTLLVVPAAQTVSGRLLPWGSALLLLGLMGTIVSFVLCPRRPWYAKAITLILMLPVAYLAVFSVVGRLV
jgi:hypothetical protein